MKTYRADFEATVTIQVELTVQDTEPPERVMAILDNAATAAANQAEITVPADAAEGKIGSLDDETFSLTARINPVSSLKGLPMTSFTDIPTFMRKKKGAKR
jgi:hypothetical protein